MPLILFVCVSVICGLTGAWGVQALTLPVCLVSFGIAVVVVAWGWSDLWAPKGRITGWEWTMYAVWAYVSFRSFFWLIYEVKNQWYIQAPNNLGDLSLHIQLIEFLSKTKEFWPVNPIFSGEPLRYSVGADFFNSMLMVLGVGLIPGLILVGFIGSMLIARQLQLWGGAFTMAGVMFGGGAAIALAWQGWELKDWQDTVNWKNLYLSMIITQRGLLYSIPAGLWLMREWHKKTNAFEIRGLWAEVLVYSTMPLFSLHAFMFLSGVILCLFALDQLNRAYWFFLSALSLLPASLLVWLVTGMARQDSIHWDLGWMQEGNPILYWILNFGIMLPLMIACVCLGWKRQQDRPMIVAGAAWFVACLFISFARWEWDNTKLMIWCWMALLPFIWTHVVSRLHPAVKILVLSGLFATGFVSVYARTTSHGHFQLAKLSELGDAEELTRGMPHRTRILAAPTYNHPLGLIGKPLIAGYDGHLWSHGIDYGKTTAMIRGILRGDANWEDMAKRLEVNYIYWGPVERRMFPESSRPWEKKGLPYASSGGSAIFEVTKPF